MTMEEEYTYVLIFVSAILFATIGTYSGMFVGDLTEATVDFDDVFENHKAQFIGDNPGHDNYFEEGMDLQKLKTQLSFYYSNVISEYEDEMIPLEKQIEMARIGLHFKSIEMGEELPDISHLKGEYSFPSEAVFSILEEMEESYNMGVEIDENARNNIQELDNLPIDQRRALVDTLNSYLAYHRTVNEHIELNGHNMQEVIENPDLVNVNHPQIYASYDLLLGSILDLNGVFSEREDNMDNVIELPPYILIDLSIGKERIYTEGYVLGIVISTLDLEDIDIDTRKFYNNAGGSNIFGDCGSFEDSIEEIDFAPISSALIHIGGSDNEYGDGNGSCGTNGGAAEGAGFLFSNSIGDTKFNADREGTNGGASSPGAGFLFSSASLGDVEFNSAGTGTNGGATGGASSGFLFSQVWGGVEFNAGSRGTNGGAANGGSGFLFSHSWDSKFNAGSRGTNGGAEGFDDIIDRINPNEPDVYLEYGSGFLFVGHNNDLEIIAKSDGTNGGAKGLGASGFLQSYTPAYIGGSADFEAGNHGVNGGGTDLGIGTVVSFSEEVACFRDKANNETGDDVPPALRAGQCNDGWNSPSINQKEESGIVINFNNLRGIIIFPPVPDPDRDMEYIVVAHPTNPDMKDLRI